MAPSAGDRPAIKDVSCSAMSENDEKLSAKETARRRDDALQRALNTPPSLHKEESSIKKTNRRLAKSKKRT
jgi:hypothetical protein